jgi:hypothetical protein
MSYIFIILIMLFFALILDGINDYEKRGERFIWGHLAKEKETSPWRTGRYFSHVGQMNFNFEWSFLHRCSTSMSYVFGADDEDIQFHIAINGLFSLWFSIAYLPFLHSAFKTIRSNYGYETGFSFHGDALYIYFCYSDMWGCGRDLLDLEYLSLYPGATYKDYNNWHGVYLCFSYVDMILGKMDYWQVPLSEPVKLFAKIEPDTTILGKTYEVSITMTTSYRKRKRWFATSWTVGDASINPPIPIPGKGESEWDLEEDSFSAIHCTGNTPQLVLTGIEAYVAERRAKYGLPASIHQEMHNEKA